MATKLAFLSDDHQFAIANVAVRSGQMETHIEHAIRACLWTHQKTAEFALKNLGADRIVGVLEAALLDLFPGDASTIENMIAEIKRIRGERNEIIHWIWGKGADEEVAVHVSYRPFREQQSKTKTAYQIQHIADQMLGVSKALVWWQNQLFANARQSSGAEAKPSTPTRDDPPP